MSKRFTGRKLTTHEFKNLNQCMECRHMEYIPKNSICEKCKKLNRTRCKQCECILKNDKEKKNRYYLYIDDYNGKEKIKRHYLSKRLIKEYLVIDKIHFKKHSNDLCQDCFNRINYIKKHYLELNNCVGKCKGVLLENPTPDKMVEHFRINGQYCVNCNNL